MSSIDKRIVQMQFDNGQFESGVSRTMSTLKRLNESLKMKNASDGLNEVDKGIKNVSSSGLSGLANGVSSVTAKFSALGVIAATALGNITNKAVNAGLSLAKSLTVEPIMTGFSEYETKMGSIQTILTNTAHAGTTLEDVTKVLNDLNTYSDQTIYNFAEMTRNIGTFTAAGIDLDTSAAAIKGIANLAAASGSNSQQASTAMYQLSQALAAGKVSLADWNSVVNAGMGGKLFQDALIRTSEQLGTGAESMIEKFGSFRESLTKGEWLTSEVLTETLKQLSGAYTEADLIAQGYNKSQAKQIVELAKNATAAATEVKTVTQLIDTMKESVQSGWAQTWEYIIGDKDQATKTLTAISDGFNNIIKPSVDARNAMFKAWNEAGGRDDIIKGFSNIFGSVGKVFGSIKGSLDDIFPPMTGEKLKAISEGFLNLTENFKISGKAAGNIRKTFEGIFSAFKIGVDVVKGLFTAVSPIGTVFKGIGSVLLSVTSGIGSFVTKISQAIDKSNIFSTMGEKIKAGFESVFDFFGNIGESIGNFFDNIDFTKMISGIGTALKPFADGFGVILEGLGKGIGSIDFGTILGGLFAGGVLGGFKGLTDAIKQIGDSFSTMFENLGGAAENVSGLLDSVRESLQAWQSNLNAGTLLKIAGAVGILAASLAVLSTIDAGKLGVAFLGITGLFVDLVAALAVLNMIDFGKFKGIIKISTSMILLATAISILAGAMKKMSGLSWENVGIGLTTITILLAELIAVSKLMDKSSKGMIKSATGLVIFAAAINILVSAVKKLGESDPTQMMTGLIGIGMLLTELGIFMKLTQASKMGIGSAVGLLTLAAALNVFAQAVKSLGDMDTGGMIQGLAGIGAVLLELAIFSKICSGGANLIAIGVAMIAMGAAMNILAGAVRSFAAMNWSELAVGLTGMAAALVAVGVAGTLINGGQMLLGAVGLAAMGASLLVVAAALKSFGSMSWAELGVGIVALAGSLTVLAVAMYAMTGAIAGAAAMLVMAGALAIFTPQLIALSQLSLGQVGTGLLALAGAFAVLGVAGLVLTPLTPVLLALGLAVGLLGAGCLAAGAGISAFATGLALLATVGAAGAQAITNVFKELIALLPQLGLKMGEAFVNMAAAIGQGATTIATAFGQIIQAILTSITTNIPAIVDAGLQLVSALLDILAQSVPKMVDAGLKLITGVLEGIASNIGGIIEAGTNVVVNFLNGIAASLGPVIEAGINLALSFIEGVANGISNSQGRLEAAISSVISAMLTAGLAVIKGGISGFISGGTELMQGFCNGVKSMMSSAGTAVKSCIDAAKNAASNLSGALVSAGASLIQGFVSGIKSVAGSVASAAKGVVQGAIDAAKSVLKINSPSKVFMEIGEYTGEGMAIGLQRSARSVAKPAEEMADKTVLAVRRALDRVGNALSGDIDSNPVITPVLDLSNVQQGSKTIGQLMSQNGTLSLNARTAGAISSTVGRVQNGNDNSDIISALKDLKDGLNNTGGNTYQVNGITYDDGSNVINAVETLVRAAKIERRI